MTGKLSVAIDRPYSQSITVSIISSNPAVARAIPESVTFAPNTVMAHVVEVFAPVDDDTVPDSTTLTVFSQETGSAAVTVNVDDPDVQTLIPDASSVTMTEGRTENLTFRLFKRPASAVVVTLNASTADKLALGTTSLTFDASNFSVPQAVTLTAPQDPDAMAEHVSVTATPTGNVPPVNIPVTIIDDDAVNLDISPASVSLSEGSGMVITTGTVKVALTRAPATDVTVNVVSSIPGKVTVSPATLTFTAANFATAQTVTATPVPDDDAADEHATLTFSVTGVDPAPASRDVAVSIHDTDSQSLKVTPLMLSTTEGTSSTFTVALLLKPDGPTTVNIYSQNPGKLEVNPPVLTFNSADFATPKVVTVKALEDDDLVDDQIEVALITPTAMKDTSVKVTIADNDHQAIQLIPSGGGTSLIMQESRSGGAVSTSTVGVRLAYRPAGEFKVNLSSSSDKLTYSPNSLSFSPSDYSVPKFAVLAAPHDNDMVDDYVLFSGSTLDIPATSLPVTIIDTDVLNFDLSGTANPLAVSESYFPVMMVSPPAPLMLKLTVQPATDVTVTFTSSSSKVTVTPATCTIPGGAAGGNAYLMACPGTVVTAVPDDDGRSETAVITVSAPGLTSRTVPVVVTDNDVQALVVPPESPGLMIDEGGTKTFSVGLKLNPVVPVSVNLYSDTPAHFDVTPSTLTFSSKEPQTVTVRALNDDDMQDYSGKIVVQGASAGVEASSKVSVTEVNSDKQAIVLTSGPALTLTENTMTMIGVHLTYRPDPAKSDMVTLSSSDADKLSIVGAAPIFTNQDYLTNKAVTISAARDHSIGAGKVTLTAASNLMGALAASSVPVSVTITDIDALNFIVTKSSVGPLSEMTNAKDMFNVTLTANPPTPVNVKVESSLPESLEAKFDSNACTLTDMSSICTVSVKALTDLNAQNESGTIVVSDASSPSQNIAAVMVSASTLDKDVQQIDFTPGGDMLIDEPPHDGTNPAGTTATFKVALHAQPPSDGTVVNITWLPLPATKNDGIDISPTQLTFDRANYSTPQTVTIKGIADNDLRTDAFSVRLSAPTLAIPDRFFNVAEGDKDTQEIVITKAVMDGGGGWSCDGTIVPQGQMIQSVQEGTSVPTAFCANLRYEPLTNTVVDAVASLSNLTVVTPMMMPLSFTIAAGGPNGYAAPHLVQIFASSDNMSTGDLSASVNLSSSGFAATRNVSFMVEDKQKQQLLLTRPNGDAVVSPVDVAPGPVTLKLRLAFRSSGGDVDVSCGLEMALAHVSLAKADYKLSGTTPQDVVISTMAASMSIVETGNLTCVADSLSTAITLRAIPAVN